jgi:hypothetical protein
MKSFPSGKKIGPHIYYHVEVIESLEPKQRAQIDAAFEIAQLTPRERINVIKLSLLAESVSLLEYANFFDDAFPVLANFWTVDLVNRTFRFRTYADSLNPPVLHRKELLLRQDHPQNELFRALTVSAEQIGLFDDPN